MSYKLITGIKTFKRTNLRFYGLSKAQVGRVLADLIDSGKCSVRIEKINNSDVRQYKAFLQS